MTLEQRLTEALHYADDFEPSPDLFARVERSITEDLAFRRRRLWMIASIVAGLGAMAAYLALVVGSGPQGTTVVTWKIELLVTAIMGAMVIVLAPNIRRFGRGFVSDVFVLSPETGQRYLKLLDLSYYLVFTGLILVTADLSTLSAVVDFPEAIVDSTWRLGVFLLAMGVLHALNVSALPFVGLVMNAVVRLARRRAAGDDAPPAALRAVWADRLARDFVIALLALAIVGGLTIVVNVIFGLSSGG